MSTSSPFDTVRSGVFVFIFLVILDMSFFISSAAVDVRPAPERAEKATPNKVLGGVIEFLLLSSLVGGRETGEDVDDFDDNVV